MKKTFSLTGFPLENKTVLLRVDLNVPLDKQGKILDDKRIKETFPTIRYLIKKKLKIVLLSHLGSPSGMVVERLKMDKIAFELQKLLKKPIYKLDDCIGPAVKKSIQKLKPGEIALLENLRFHPEEEKNDLNFARELASLGDYYVNDAFGTLHRSHASVEAITDFLPAAPGFLVEKELRNLCPVLKPKRPLVWLVGGIKKDKYLALKQILKKADYVLLGSGLADFVEAKEKKNKRLILPVDFIYDKQNKKLDIGPRTILLFQSYLKKAKTIIWNGPLGFFEKPAYAQGTKKIAQFIAKLKAIKIIGGGETSEAIEKFHLAKKMAWVSTGGGASLEFLLGKKLPGIAALERNYPKFKRII